MKLRVLVFILSIPFALTAQVISTPPTSQVRTMAEWEELQSLMITWRTSSYYPILTEIVRAAREECNVVITCTNTSQATSAQNTLTAAGVDLSSNVEFVVIPSNSVWIRDYGPNPVYTNNVDSLLLVDWIYNRDRPNDNTLPQKYGAMAGIPVYGTTTAPYDLVNTGGNFMSDGLGMAFASKLIYRNNDQIMNGEGNNPNDVFGTTNHTPESIREVLAEFMGIDTYITMEELPYDGIHHIDMHMKLLDEETLLVGKYPEGISDGPQLEANLLYVLNQFQTHFGRNFRVVRVPMPSFGGEYPPYTANSGLYPTYANAVFVNKTIIMPKYNHVLDAAAQDTFQKYLPGYNVVQIDCNAMIGAGGAIHCITKEIGTANPLHIAHAAIRSADISYPETWHATALAQHKSGIAAVKLYYTTDLNGNWSAVDMTPDVMPEYWAADIPQQPQGSTVYYYIEATANSGKVQVKPMPAPAGYYEFKVNQTSSTNLVESLKTSPVFPNPARAMTVVPVNMTVAMQGSISLVNEIGQTVATIYNGELSQGRSNYFIEANRYPAGAYQVVVRTAFQTETQQLIIAD